MHLRRTAALATAIAIVALAGGLGSTAPGTPVARQSIVGGETANFDNWRFTVAVFNKEVGFWCGGSVIDPTTVLTAAHCAKGVRTEDLFVVANRFRLSNTDQGQRIEVSAKRIDPDFSSADLRHDFALLTLLSPTSAPAVKLATPEQDAAATGPGDRLKLAGWGSTESETLALPGYLKSTAMRAKKPGICKRAFGWMFSLHTNICAQGQRVPKGKGRRTADCNGDSGGPIVAHTPEGRRLVGVVSYGGLVCGIGPAAFARTSGDLAFILGV